MSPTRRVQLGIGGLLAAMLVLTLLTWHLQTRALSEALVQDVQATLASRVSRATSAKHENGYACFAAVERLTPKDLSPVDASSHEAFKAALDGGVLPEDWQPKLEALAPWAASLRDCADAAALDFLPGVTPFELRNERGSEMIMALARLTRLQLRELEAKRDWVESAERCASTLEVSLDRSHLNFQGAMMARRAVTQLAAPCGQALFLLAPEARSRVKARFEALPTRLVTNGVLTDRDRLWISLGSYSWLLPPELSTRGPEGFALFGGRFVLLRLWSRLDRAMRGLVAAADTRGPARLEAERAVDDTFSTWWAPRQPVSLPDYEKFFLRNEETMTLLQLLAHLASSEGALPAGVSRTSEGYEVTNFEGARLLVPATR